MRLTHYDEHKKRWQINDDYGAVVIDELNYAVGEAIDKLAAYEDAEEQGRLGWIPVTERLPKSGVHVLASCRVKYVGGGGRSYVCDAFYSERFKEQRSTEYDDIELDYDEETDEYYLPEGWWEVIMNWDEYGFVGIEDFVTHWMPMPEPPQEG